jgi:hypothetical protein
VDLGVRTNHRQKVRLRRGASNQGGGGDDEGEDDEMQADNDSPNDDIPM